MGKYKRSLDELRPHAVLHWPSAILTKAGVDSALPLLLETQDSFISVLKVADKDPMSWKSVLDESSKLTGILFLKHLMVISDIGGEALNKLPPLDRYIPFGKMKFIWNGNVQTYIFKEVMDKCVLSNSSLKVDGKGLTTGKTHGRHDLDDKAIDVCMLIMYGSSSTNDTLPQEIKEKCVIGDLLGIPEQLDEFIKRRYLYVSKQVSGAQSNRLGQLVQEHVANKLKFHLGDSWDVSINSSLPEVFHSLGSSATGFDIVAISPDKKYYGIEVSFQVTTNSVIERKARESKALMDSVHGKGHKICYVIDGAGNINIRKNAVETLCRHSDCTVAMSDVEIEHLARFCKSL